MERMECLKLVVSERRNDHWVDLSPHVFACHPIEKIAKVRLEIQAGRWRYETCRMCWEVAGLGGRALSDHDLMIAYLA